MTKRSFLQSAVLLAAAGLLTSAAQAQSGAPAPIKFQLDWRFEGPRPSSCRPRPKGISRRRA